MMEQSARVVVPATQRSQEEQQPNRGENGRKAGKERKIKKLNEAILMPLHSSINRDVFDHIMLKMHLSATL